jgi:hypothetical protein
MDSAAFGRTTSDRATSTGSAPPNERSATGLPDGHMTGATKGVGHTAIPNGEARPEDARTQVSQRGISIPRAGPAPSARSSDCVRRSLRPAGTRLGFLWTTRACQKNLQHWQDRRRPIGSAFEFRRAWPQSDQPDRFDPPDPASPLPATEPMSRKCPRKPRKRKTTLRDPKQASGTIWQRMAGFSNITGMPPGAGGRFRQVLARFPVVHSVGGRPAQPSEPRNLLQAATLQNVASVSHQGSGRGTASSGETFPSPSDADKARICFTPLIASH